MSGITASGGVSQVTSDALVNLYASNLSTNNMLSNVATMGSVVFNSTSNNTTLLFNCNKSTEPSVSGVYILNSNTSGSDSNAVSLMRVSNISAGNAFCAFDSASRGGYSCGLNNSDLSFKIASSYSSIDVNTRVYISSNGNVGIGTTAPSAKLEVNGPIKCSGLLALDTAGNMTMMGDLTSFDSVSDRRFKTNIRSITDNVDDIIMALNPCVYTWKDDVFNQAKRGMDDVGFIAQEIEEVIPKAVSKFNIPDSDVEYKRIKYERIMPYIIKSLQNVIETQKTILDKLEKLENN